MEPQGQPRPLVNRRSFVLVIALGTVIGLFVLWKRANIISPPFTPPDIGRLHQREYLGGLVSMSDDYIMLLSKADAYQKPELLQYLRSLDHLSPGERLNVGQAFDHGPIMLRVLPSGFTEIHVPGDLQLAALNWDSTVAQSATVAATHQHVEITPEVLRALNQRKQQLLNLGVSPPPPPVANNFPSTLSGVMGRNGNYGEAFICVNGVPMYRYPLTTSPPGSGLNKKPAGYTAAGMHVYKTGLFGPGSSLAGETQIKLFPNSSVLYFVKSDLLKDHCQ